MLFLIANRRYLVGDLVNSVKKLPKDFRDGKAAAEDPAAAAKPVLPSNKDEPRDP